MLEINKIHHGDCLELMKQIPDKSIDLVLTDPPYEQEFHGGGIQQRAKDYNIVKKRTDFMNNGYNYKNIIPELIRVCKIPNIIMFCSNSQIGKTMTTFEEYNLKPTLLIWHKTNACPLGNGKYISDIEYVVYTRGTGATFNNVNVSKKYKIKSYPFCHNKIHPAEKPIKLILEYIQTHSSGNDIILDPFSGSGTTAIACSELKRNFICIEKDFGYWKTSCERLDNYNKQLKLF